MIKSLFNNKEAILEIWCEQYIGIQEIQLVLKFQIFNYIRARGIRVYAIFTLLENRKLIQNLAR